MAQKRRGQLLRRNAAAVVRHADEAHAAVANFHGNGGGAGIQCVFHQLLHHAGRTLHHLTGCNEIRHMGGKLFDLRHGMHLVSQVNQGSEISARPPMWPKR